MEPEIFSDFNRMYEWKFSNWVRLVSLQLATTYRDGTNEAMAIGILWNIAEREGFLSIWRFTVTVGIDGSVFYIMQKTILYIFIWRIYIVFI